MTDETNPGKVLGKSSQMAIQLTKWQNKKEQNITKHYNHPDQNLSACILMTSSYSACKQKCVQ